MATKQEWLDGGYDATKMLQMIDKQFGPLVLVASDNIEKFAPYIGMAYDLGNEKSDATGDEILAWFTEQADKSGLVFCQVMAFMLNLQQKALADGVIDKDGNLIEKGPEA